MEAVMADTGAKKLGKPSTEGQEQDSRSLLPKVPNTSTSSATSLSGNNQDETSPCWAHLYARVRFLVICCAILAVIVVVLTIVIAVLASGKGPAPSISAVYASGKGPDPYQEPCPKNWTYTERTCYYLSAEETDWESSFNICRSEGASLLVMKSRKDLHFTQNQICGKEFWIGLTRNGGALTWVDGSPYNQSLFHIKVSGECAFIDKNGISMSGCHLPQRWICRMEPDRSGGEAGTLRYRPYPVPRP